MKRDGCVDPQQWFLAVSSVRRCSGLLAGAAGGSPWPHGQNVLYRAAPASANSVAAHPTSNSHHDIQCQLLSCWRSELEPFTETNSNQPSAHQAVHDSMMNTSKARCESRQSKRMWQRLASTSRVLRGLTVQLIC